MDLFHQTAGEQARPGAPHRDRICGRPCPWPVRPPASRVSRSPRPSCLRRPVGRAEVLHPDADQPQPDVLQARRPRRARRRGVETPGRRRWARAGVRERVMVVKSARRSLTLTVRPTCPAARAARPPARTAAAAPGGSPRGRRCRGEGLLGADALVGPCGVTRRSSRPQASAAGARRPPGRARAGGSPQGSWARSPTVWMPSRCSDLLGALSDAPQRRRRAAGAGSRHLVGGHDEQAVGLAVARGELGHELGARDPDRAGDAVLVGDLRADHAGRSGGLPEPARAPRDVEERLVERERLDQRGDRRKISMTAAETAAYLSWLGGMTTACGQSRRARVIGIAEWTPNLRAS